MDKIFCADEKISCKAIRYFVQEIKYSVPLAPKKRGLIGLFFFFLTRLFKSDIPSLIIPH